MQRVKVISIVLIASLALLITHLYFTAPPLGFCVEQNRFITVDEYIKFSTGVRFKDQKIEDNRYSILNCCEAIKRERGFWSTIFRVDEGVGVDWYFERNEAAMASHDHEDKYYAVFHVINTCATKFIVDSGITEKSLPELKGTENSIPETLEYVR